MYVVTCQALCASLFGISAGIWLQQQSYFAATLFFTASICSVCAAAFKAKTLDSA